MHVYIPSEVVSTTERFGGLFTRTYPSHMNREMVRKSSVDHGIQMLFVLYKEQQITRKRILEEVVSKSKSIKVYKYCKNWYTLICWHAFINLFVHNSVSMPSWEARGWKAPGQSWFGLERHMGFHIYACELC